MAVPEQTPYKEYTANGVTTSFPLEFDCENQDHLIVTVNDIEPENGQWSLINGAVVFLIAPANQAKIVIQRNTPLERNTNYQTTNNSFRPQPVNKDFDRIWWKLQELGVTNWLTDTDIKNLSAYVNSLNDETRDEFYNNLGNLEKNTKAMLDEAIKNGAVSALAITTVDTVEELEDLNAWEGRTVSVTSIGNYKYNSSTLTWERDFITDRQVVTVNSIEELLSLPKWDGRTVTVKGYHPATNFALLKSFKGGGTFVYNSLLVGQNDGGLVINGWVRQDVTELDPYMFGAKGGFTKGSVEIDDTVAFKNAIKSAVANKYYKLHVPSDYFLITDELLLNGITYILDQTKTVELQRNRWENVLTGCEIVGDGSLSTNIVFKPKTKESVCFSVRGGWGSQSRRNIRGLSILPYERSGNALTDTTDADGIAIELQGCCFTQVCDVYIDRFNVGIRFLNTAFYDFTEFNRLSNINIYGCDNCIWFYTNHKNATDSFHGNSFYSTKVQPNQNGGIGLRVSGTDGNDARPYNCHFDINFFGGSNKGPTGEQVYFIYLDAGVVISASGNMTSEGVGKFYCADDFSYFESSGSYFSYDDLSDWEWNLVSNWRQDQPFAFKWENISSPAYGSISDPILGSSRIEQTDLLSRNGVHPSIYSANRPENGFLGTGLVFEHIGGFGKGWTFAVKEPSSTAKKLYSRWNFSVAGNKFMALGGYLETAVNNKTLTLLSESTFGPTSNATLDSARASNVWKNIYSQNAVTVVSDARHKTEISELTEQELQCAIACSKLYRKYKLNAAVDEKGVNTARYHVGVIAQEIVQCFTDHGLDWRKYGIITYEKWDAIEAVEYQAATYDENGQELTPEVQAVEGRAAGEIYMVRYDELNCFINAGLEYRLSKIEAKLID